MDQNIYKSAWNELQSSIVTFKGEPVGTVAARDPETQALNYDQVFTRDFAVSAIAFLVNGEYRIVKNFLRQLLHLQSREKHFDCFKPGQGMMPVSFRIEKDADGNETINPDFGEKAIGKVAPVDAVFWWLYVLRLYTVFSGDRNFARQEDVQQGIRLILDLSLTSRFDMFPTLLVPDGSFMIDRRMGVYGYPLDIQSLFYMALLASRELLEENETNQPYRKAVYERLGHLVYHIRKYYWLDFDRLNEMYRYDVEGYGASTQNAFNIYPETIPEWLLEWLPREGGYFAGNLGPARMDFRFFTSGNLLAVISSLASKEQTHSIMELIGSRWEDLVGDMPVKVCYPAIRSEQWKILTGADPKNVPWSYHNAAGWPFLLWAMTTAAIQSGYSEMARQALKIAEQRIEKDRWPEYYDGKTNRLIGKEARLYQTWTFAGYIAAYKLLENTGLADSITFPEDQEVIACSVRTRSLYEEEYYLPEDSIKTIKPGDKDQIT
ncbi:MAG: glycoside hydrolase 100 family protein [Bacteroidales bacterium]